MTKSKPEFRKTRLWKRIYSSIQYEFSLLRPSPTGLADRIYKSMKMVPKSKDKKKGLFISHGRVTHPAEERYDCLDCIDVEIEYLKALKRAGGVTKFLKQLKQLKPLKADEPNEEGGAENETT